MGGREEASRCWGHYPFSSVKASSGWMIFSKGDGRTGILASCIKFKETKNKRNFET
jgi:hypothetical protein